VDVRPAMAVTLKGKLGKSAPLMGKAGSIGRGAGDFGALVMGGFLALTSGLELPWGGGQAFLS
jgi:hypothetical protein